MRHGAAQAVLVAPQPQVSIILNLRNGRATLAETLRSVLAQDFIDWELQVWDDVSTDGSADVVAAFADSRIRYHASTEHDHLAGARWRAVAQARAPWVAFVDQDDLWLPHKLRCQLALAAPGVGLIYGRTLKFFEDGSKRDFDHRHEHQPLPEGDVFLALVQQSCFICMSSVLLRRDALWAVPQPPPWLAVAPDYYFFLCISRTQQARAVQDPVCLYRVHAGGMTAGSLLHIQNEALQMLTLYQAALPEPLLRQRQRVHHTVGAYVQLCSAGQRRAGWQRLWQQGSIGYLLSRPFARAWRALRRQWQAPYWVQAAQRAGRGRT